MKLLASLIRKRPRTFRFILILIISFFFQIFLWEATYSFYPQYREQSELLIGEEKYDPGLGRLNSVEKFSAFCDSLYGSTTIGTADSGKYANLVANIVRYRFVHGYSWYSLGHNYVAKLLAPAIHSDLSAIVIPDDILEYPNAACSQQSLVAMKVLMDKGFLVRKVGFFDKKYGGHFCYEVRYEGGWHFYDPDREPDAEILVSNNRPSIEYLNEHRDLLLAAYPRDTADLVLSLYSTYSYGKPGKLPGKKAILFQTFTKFLSYTLWIVLAVFFILIDRRLLTKKKDEVGSAIPESSIGAS